MSRQRQATIIGMTHQGTEIDISTLDIGQILVRAGVVEIVEYIQPIVIGKSERCCKIDQLVTAD